MFGGPAGLQGLGRSLKKGAGGPPYKNQAGYHSEVTDRWQKSRALLERAQASLAGGVSSPFRAKFPIPLYFADGCGCRLRDVDGNEYIDHALAWGPAILGYRHPKVVEAVQKAAAGPHIYGSEHELEILVAEK